MLLLLFSLMRWIPCAANGLKAMRVKHLDVSKQNFLYRCRNDDQKVLILAATNTPYALDQSECRLVVDVLISEYTSLSQI
ncbi:hypothetical protein TIFTF001_035937 [Ficus carica]|uniref:ATPase AAA-type core domain-containing protein n=1 Tax=Ficus carica TaxID=3494 RepID=A0AA88E2H0_FICCA|nr:hypothetical protein TIFTF001_035937 [Ficus carica]